MASMGASGRTPASRPSGRASRPASEAAVYHSDPPDSSEQPVHSPASNSSDGRSRVIASVTLAYVTSKRCRETRGARRLAAVCPRQEGLSCTAGLVRLGARGRDLGDDSGRVLHRDSLTASWNCSVDPAPFGTPHHGRAPTTSPAVMTGRPSLGRCQRRTRSATTVFFAVIAGQRSAFVLSWARIARARCVLFRVVDRRNGAARADHDASKTPCYRDMTLAIWCA